MKNGLTIFLFVLLAMNATSQVYSLYLSVNGTNKYIKEGTDSVYTHDGNNYIFDRRVSVKRFTPHSMVTNAPTAISNVDSTQFQTKYRSDTGRANLYAALAAKQAALTTGTTSQYLKGDLSLGTYHGYAISGGAANASTTTDAQTIYFGGTPGQAPSATGGNQRLYIPKSGTITAVYVFANAGTAGTNEAWVMNVRLNNTTNTQIQSLSANTANRTWSNTGLSIAVVAGDYIEIQSVNPTWATNPANVRTGVVAYIE